MTIEKIICEGCDSEMLFSPGLHDICWDCVKARHRGVVNGKCTCGKKAKPVEIMQAGAKRMKCRRCLAGIR